MCYPPIMKDDVYKNAMVYTLAFMFLLTLTTAIK